MASRLNPLRRLRVPPWSEQRPSWPEAKPELIDAALARALARPAGNWYVFGASAALPTGRPLGRTVAGVELVAWRGTDGRLCVGPGACPHLGAPLCDGSVHGGRLVCRWHGLSLSPSGRRDWAPYPAHDDGVLLWVRLDEVGGEEPLPFPVVPRRPPLAESVATVASAAGRCEPEDVVANRLDPWHGSWYHPYAFAGLRVISAPPLDCADADDAFVVDVAYRVAGSLGVPVTAEFRCPGPRTVVMTIVSGEFAGSVVETHATPLAPGRTAVIEAVCAHTNRRGFARTAPLLRPLIRRASHRLWRDDLAYAERRYSLRNP